MNCEHFINKSQNLYEKIFNESIKDSSEYAIFAKGNFNPLRLKIEFELETINNELSEQISLNKRKLLCNRRDLLKELEVILMEYIECNIEQ